MPTKLDCGQRRSYSCTHGRNRVFVSTESAANVMQMSLFDWNSKLRSGVLTPCFSRSIQRSTTAASASDSGNGGKHSLTTRFMALSFHAATWETIISLLGTERNYFIQSRDDQSCFNR